ncbi:MAG TPA: CopD family protein [Steroidobacteraceae bacterium]|nr:CopD family protein [Steroidobacteraceae bacterium]
MTFVHLVSAVGRGFAAAGVSWPSGAIVSPDIVFVACVAVSFVLLLQAAGVAIFIALWGTRLGRTRGVLAAQGRKMALAAIVAAVFSHSLEAVRLAGEWAGWTDISMQEIAWQSPAARALCERVVALGAIAFGLCGNTTANGVRRTLAALGALLVPGSFFLAGHAMVSSHRFAASGLLYVHVLIVAFWFGALWPLQRVSAEEPPPLAASIIDAFSTTATWLVPVILVAGVGLAITLIPSVHVLTEPYGRLLIAKAALYGALLGLASLNKWRLAPGIGRSEARAAIAFRRSVVVEYALICVVLAMTAAMTTLYSPQ